MYEYPTKDEWIKIYRSFPFERFAVHESDFLVTQLSGWDGLNQLAMIKELNAWKMALQNKWNDVAKSFVMMMFYYNKGIPDEPYFISPGNNGQSVEYLPNFEPEHFTRKDDFDFYADVYFFKVFSVFDGLWQIFNVYFNCGLDINKVSYRSLCEKLKDISPNTELSLRQLLCDERYTRGKNMRNSITHRLPTGAQGAGIRRETNAIIFTVSEYMSSNQTIEAARELLEFSVETYEQIKGFFGANETGNQNINSIEKERG